MILRLDIIVDHPEETLVRHITGETHLLQDGIITEENTIQAITKNNHIIIRETTRPTTTDTRRDDSIVTFVKWIITQLKTVILIKEIHLLQVLQSVTRTQTDRGPEATVMTEIGTNPQANLIKKTRLSAGRPERIS